MPKMPNTNSHPTNSNSAICHIKDEIFSNLATPLAAAEPPSQHYTPANPFQYNQQPDIQQFLSAPRSTTISAPNPVQYQHPPMTGIHCGFNHHFNFSHQIPQQPPPLVNLSQATHSSASLLAFSGHTNSHQAPNQLHQTQGQLVASLQ